MLEYQPGVFPADDTHHAPVVINRVEFNRVEDNAGHHFREDGAVLDEPVVVGGGLLVHDAHDPL